MLHAQSAPNAQSDHNYGPLTIINLRCPGVRDSRIARDGRRVSVARDIQGVEQRAEEAFREQCPGQYAIKRANAKTHGSDWIPYDVNDPDGLNTAPTINTTTPAQPPAVYTPAPQAMQPQPRGPRPLRSLQPRIAQGQPAPTGPYNSPDPDTSRSAIYGSQATNFSGTGALPTANTQRGSSNTSSQEQTYEGWTIQQLREMELLGCDETPRDIIWALEYVQVLASRGRLPLWKLSRPAPNNALGMPGYSAQEYSR
jgi:hypothetical protein